LFVLNKVCTDEPVANGQNLVNRPGNCCLGCVIDAANLVEKAFVVHTWIVSQSVKPMQWQPMNAIALSAAPQAIAQKTPPKARSLFLANSFY
jgi:hypothetical protein